MAEFAHGRACTRPGLCVAKLSGVDSSVAIEANNALTLRPRIRPTNVSKKRDKRIEKSLRNQLDYERRKGRLSAEKQDMLAGLNEQLKQESEKRLESERKKTMLEDELAAVSYSPIVPNLLKRIAKNLSHQLQIFSKKNRSKI